MQKNAKFSQNDFPFTTTTTTTTTGNNYTTKKIELNQFPRFSTFIGYKRHRPRPYT